MTDHRAIRSRVSDLRGPGIAKVHACDRGMGKMRASCALQQALAALRWSNRAAAEYLDVNEKIIRLWLQGAQQPAWLPLSLPRAGYLAYIDALLDNVPPDSGRGAANGC